MKQEQQRGIGFAQFTDRDVFLDRNFRRADQDFSVAKRIRIRCTIALDTVIVFGNIAAAGNHCRPAFETAIHDQQLIVGAAVGVVELGHCVEDHYLNTGLSRGQLPLAVAHETGIVSTGFQRPQGDVRAAAERAQRINGYAYIHTTLYRIAHGAEHCIADQVGLKNVIGEINRMPGVLDHPQLHGKRVDCRVVRWAQELGSGMLYRDIGLFAQFDQVFLNFLCGQPGPGFV